MFAKYFQIDFEYLYGKILADSKNYNRKVCQIKKIELPKFQNRTCLHATIIKVNAKILKKLKTKMLNV